MERRPRIALHNRIFIGLLLGAVLGASAQIALPGGRQNEGLRWVNDTLMQPIGQIFVTLIFMVVVPLLFSALVLGVSEIGDAAKVGRVGLRALMMTVLLSGIAVGIGLAGVNLVRPGDGVDPARRQELLGSIDQAEAQKKASAEASAEVDPPVLGIVPRNPLLEATRALTGGIMPFMFFALVFGIALAAIEQEKAMPVRALLEGVFAVTLKIIEYAMAFAPIGVFALVFRTASILGLDAVAAFGKYVALVLVALAVHMFVTYPLVLRFIAKRDPVQFFRQIRSVIVTAFATSSSNATLPVALKVAEEEVGIPRDIGNFVLTVGATANQNGTALFEGITIIFLCQFFGIALSLQDQFTVMMLAIVAGIGTAGVPGGAWPMIGSIIVRFGVPGSAIGLVLGIDRILDMSRTTLNVVGDITIAACVAEMEGRSREVPEEFA
ncbi:MAG: dicarboxylate/amino acid:cation symporter [Fimbriimonadaceae bacterium]|nr:dicarboxylate/amino acid:cation symporter [Fimbriimonadaceae bacterium]QYK55875.1 MAG: dicarboxylate/amino acid:cation symporter [Fimbriimonadaceae bacterium]